MKACSVCGRCYEDSILSCSEEDHGHLIDARAENCEIVANYKLEVQIESSATSETYRAVNTILKKPYLIKIIFSEAFDENQKKRFLRETQSLAAIIHQNIARVFESGTLPDGSLYVVTEFISAQTLRDCIDNVGAPSEVTALTITRQAAEGLEAIHAVGALHRSIRPENIILTTDAENHFLVKLQNLDFGGIRQKNANANAELNLSDFRYFSPEQCAAEEADAQADVYGLGVVLYEILAGKVPFDAPYADAIIAKQINETPPIVKINSFDLRMLLTHTLTDALQKTSRLRLKSANAFARRIRHIEQLATHSPTPPPAMAYPAKMDKSAIVFAPAAKVENVAQVEKKSIVEPAIPAQIETIIENPVVELVPPETEKTFAAETEIVIAESSAVEEILPAEDFIPREVTPVVEDEAAPIVEPEPPKQIFTAPAGDEIVPEIEFEAADKAPYVTEHETQERVSAPLEVKADKENEEDAPLVARFPDLTTTKLPPIETIIEKSLPEETPKYETSKLFKPPTEDAQIHESNEPVLIEWKQPDDVPTVTQALGKSRKEIADAQFSDQRDLVIDSGAVDPLPSESVSETKKARRNYADEATLFAYSGSGRSWSLPETRKILTGVGVLFLIAIAIGGTLLSRQAQSASDERRTAAQSSPNGKNLPQTTEPVKISQDDQSISPKNADLIVDNPSAENTEPEIPALPEYQPRETEPKTATPKRIKKQIVKENTEPRENVAENKAETNEVFDKKGNVRDTKDKKTSKSSMQNSPKSEVFTRPRIVKNPKN